MKKFFSPGRINIIGEHIDYSGGHVLPAAIDIGTYARVEEREDKIISLYSKNFPNDNIIEIDLQKQMEKAYNWSDYVRGVIDVLQKKGYLLTKGLSVEVNGNIPNSSGLSSSASLEVLFTYIFDYYNNLGLTRKELALYSKEAENDFVGVNCGIMDQFIIANGKSESALYLDCETLDYEYIPCELGEYSIAIMNTKKKRGLVDSAYNERRAECESAFQKLNKENKRKNLCEITVEELKLGKDTLSENEYKRAKHAITEEARVKAGALALKNGDITTLGQKLNESHKSLRGDYEVSCKELDIFVGLALENGSIGARMTGAGFGGCAIALIKTNNAKEFKEQVEAEYKKTTGITGEIYLAKVHGGVDLL